MHNFVPTDRVVFGKPAAEALLVEADRLGAKRVFLMVSRTLNTKTDAIEKVRAALGARYAGTYDGIPQHTTRGEAIRAAQAALRAEADLVVAIGGGSVVDAAKIALVCMEHGIADMDGLDPFTAVPGPDGKPVRPQFRGPRVRMISVPSTLSGGEYNAGCLVTDERRKLKQSFYHPLMAPLAVILSPGLTVHTPETLWLGSGTRAMDHGIETLCSINGSPLADAVVLRGIALMARSLKAWKRDPSDLQLRADCQVASWLCSFGLASSSFHGRMMMGASHGIGHVLGGTCDVPHYLCTPVMMSAILRWNLSATQGPQRELAAAFGYPELPAADAFKSLMTELGLPTRLAEVGVTEAQFELIGRNTMTEIFIHSNPRKVAGPADVKHNPLNAIIAPRPIGWISSRDAEGKVNLAPYSFFNAFNYAPPILGFSSIRWKDSVRNASETGEFVWNLVTMELGEQMNQTAAPFAHGVDEFEVAGLTAVPSRLVNVPRVLESRAAMECKVIHILQFQDSKGDKVNGWLVLGEVVAVHIDRSLIKDGVYQMAQAHPILRAGGLHDYVEVTPEAMFKMQRPAGSSGADSHGT
jgi:maleylacetate reductase